MYDNFYAEGKLPLCLQCLYYITFLRKLYEFFVNICKFGKNNPPIFLPFPPLSALIIPKAPTFTLFSLAAYSVTRLKTPKIPPVSPERSTLP